MGAERQLLYACARQDFGDMHESIVRDLSEGQRIDWDVVWRLARSEGVAPLVYTNLKRCTPAALGLPAPIPRPVPPPPFHHPLCL